MEKFKSKSEWKTIKNAKSTKEDLKDKVLKFFEVIVYNVKQEKERYENPEKGLIKTICFIKSLIFFLLFVALIFWIGGADRKYSFVKLLKEEILRDMERAYLEERYEEAKTIANFIKNSIYFTHEEKYKADDIYQKSENTLNSLSYKAKKCFKSILHGTPEDITSLFCVFISDITIFGDIRDVARESLNYLRGKEVDEFVLSLSALGLASPVFDFLRALKKTSALSEPLAKAILKFRNLAHIIWDIGYIWLKQVGLAPFARILKFVDDKVQLENLVRYTQNHGAVDTYLAAQRTNGKILKNYRPIAFYTSASQLIRLGTKDFLGKDGLIVAYKALKEILKENFGFVGLIILSFLVSLMYLLLNFILPFTDTKIASFFATILCFLTLVYNLYVDSMFALIP